MIHASDFLMDDLEGVTFQMADKCGIEFTTDQLWHLLAISQGTSIIYVMLNTCAYTALLEAINNTYPPLPSLTTKSSWSSSFIQKSGPAEYASTSSPAKPPTTILIASSLIKNEARPDFPISHFLEHLQGFSNPSQLARHLLFFQYQ